MYDNIFKIYFDVSGGSYDFCMCRRWNEGAEQSSRRDEA
jgi:hypothetical protein